MSPFWIPLAPFVMVLGIVGLKQLGKSFQYYLDWRMQMAERQFGIPASEAIGKRGREIFRDCETDDRAAIEATLVSGEGLNSCGVPSFSIPKRNATNLGLRDFLEVIKAGLTRTKQRSIEGPLLRPG